MSTKHTKTTITLVGDSVSALRQFQVFRAAIREPFREDELKQFKGRLVKVVMIHGKRDEIDFIV